MHGSAVGWSEAKRDAASVERQLDAALARYLSVNPDKSDPEFVGDAELAVEADVNRLIQRLQECVERLQACADKPAVAEAFIQRPRELIISQRQKFRFHQNKLKQLRESEALRRAMQREAAGMNGNADARAQELLMRERTSLMNSSRLAGGIIDGALETHSDLVRQRLLATGTMGKVVDIGRQLPGINTLIQRIEDKRTRDNTIIAIVAALCICFILWYILRGWGVA